MNSADSKLIEQAKDFKPAPGYDVGMSALLEVATMFNNNLINGFGLIYAMGYIKGQRAAKRTTK